jgi:MoaA/NifB/PqqE/SkfB family radical SAM enzyme
MCRGDELKSLSKQQRVVRTARWDLYPHCNLNCRHCCADGLYNYINKEFLNLDAAVLLLNKLWEDGIIHLNILGKEPFLHPNIFSILKHACQLGFTVDITTNGTTIEEKDISLLVDLGIRCIYFSIDGSTAKINNMIRGDGVFEKASVTMMKVIKEKERKHSELMVSVNTVLTKINATDIVNLADMCDSMGVKFFKLSHLLTLGQALANLNDLAIEPYEEFKIAEEVIKNIPQHPALAYDVLSDHPLLLEYFYKKYKVSFPVRMSGCKACIEEIYIDPVGGITPCLGTSRGIPEFSGGKDYRVDIFDHYEKPIYKSSFYDEFQSTFPMEKETYRDYTPCHSCPYLATICYPCPLDSLSGGHVEELCFIAKKKLDQLDEEKG